MTQGRPSNPKSHGHVHEEDVERMIADWRSFAIAQRQVAALTGNPAARMHAERYDRLATQAQELLDTQQTFYSPPAAPVSLVPKPAPSPPRTRRSRLSKAPGGPSVGVGLRCLNCGRRISRLEWDSLNFQEVFQCCEAKDLREEKEIVDG